jgi:acetyltransferase-like isoleucine patch superfamily enzyme
MNAHLGHDVTIGDHTIISVGAIVLGRATIGSDCYVGAGAIVIEGVTIGNGCTVTAGSVVYKNVLNNQIVQGNPAVSYAK